MSLKVGSCQQGFFPAPWWMTVFSTRNRNQRTKGASACRQAADEPPTADEET